MRHAGQLIIRAARLVRLGDDAAAVKALRSASEALADRASATAILHDGEHLAHLIATASEGHAPAWWRAHHCDSIDGAPRAVLDNLEAWAEMLWAREQPSEQWRADKTDDAALNAVLRACTLAGAARALARRRQHVAARDLCLEAVALWRACAGEEAIRRARLADSLRLLGALQLNLGRQSEGLAATGEACRMLRELAQCDRERFSPLLASGLHNLAGARLLGEDETGAAAAATSAIALRRELAERVPLLYLPDLVESLSEAAHVLCEAGAPSEALLLSGEAVGVARALFDTHGEECAWAFVGAMQRHAQSALAAESWEEGLRTVDEEIAFLGQATLAHSQSGATALAEAMHNRATFLSMLGDDHGALSSLAEAITLRGEHGAPATQFAQQGLGASLHFAGAIAARLDDAQEAAHWFEQALAVRSHLAEQGRPGARADVVQSGLELCRVCVELVRLPEARAAMDVVVSMLRTLCTEAPDGPTVQRLARALMQSGDVSRRAGAIDAAIEAYAEAALLHEKIEALGGRADVSLSATQKLIVCLKRAGRAEEAEEWRRRLDA